LAAVNAAVIVPRPAAAARSGYDWVTSWSASPQDPMPGTLGMAGFHDQTVRDIIYASVGGNTIRLELTTAFGRSPLEVGRGADAFTIATASWYYLSGLDVRSSGSAGTLVAFGDSITDGVQSTVGGNDRWPNDLARRLDTVAGPTLSVADGGIGGNRVLTASRC